MRDMSSDGAIDKPRPARPVRGDDRGAAGIALVVLLVLALIATVVMVFSDNPVWMRIGTLSALWSAFIGAFLVARYRRQAASEAARVRDLHTVYELQLEREISARREHELVVEKELRDSVRVETADSISGLRQEIAALREQLGQLGVTLPEDRFAVGGHAPAGQLRAGSSLPSVPSERVEPRRRIPAEPVPATPSTSTPSPATPDPTVAGVGRDVTPSTERTEKLSPVAAENARPAERSRRPAVRPSAGRETAQSATPSSPADAPKAHPGTGSATDQPTPAARRSGSTSAPSSASSSTPEAERKTSPTTEPVAEPEPGSRHGEGGGLSVAELMARLGGDNPTSGGRRRRHSAE